MSEDVFLAYEMNGQPLAPQHGFPLRLIVPGWLGMTNVKWLDSIEVIPKKFGGSQMKWYSFAKNDNDPSRVPLTDMKVRALMIPPGIPNFSRASATSRRRPRRASRPRLGRSSRHQQGPSECRRWRHLGARQARRPNRKICWVGSTSAWEKPKVGNYVLRQGH